MKGYIISQEILVFPKFLKINLKSFLVFNLLLAWLLFTLYIVQAGLFTQQIYLQKEYQKEISQLSKENEILEIEFAKSSSLSHIENYFQENSFVKTNPNRVKYIQIFEDSLATNK